MRHELLSVPLALTTFLSGCGGSEPSSGADASVETGTDGGQSGDSSGLDVGPTDASGDGGPAYPPATWSRAADHIGYAMLLAESVQSSSIGSLPCLSINQTTARSWVGEGAVGFDLGKGPQAQRARFRLRMDAGGKTCGSVQSPMVLSTANFGNPSGRFVDAQDLDTGMLITRDEGAIAVADYLRDSSPTWVEASCPGGTVRLHAIDYGRTTLVVDSCSTGTTGTTLVGGGSAPVGGMGITDSAAKKGYPSPTSTVSIAVDAIEPSLAGIDQFVMIGRLSGPTFDFDINTPVVGDVSGSGYFQLLVTRTPTTFTLDAVNLFGGTPPAPPGGIEEPGTVARLHDGIVTLTFEGTMSVGGKTLTAPANAPATAVLIYSHSGNTYALASAFAFGKGPAAKGKFNRPRAVRVAQDRFVLADTVWDTLDVNGTSLVAKQGADVALVTFDGTGKVLSTRMYGGPGDDESYELTSAPPLTSVFWTGHSVSSIDFGNGPLSTSASDGEGWAVELVP